MTRLVWGAATDVGLARLENEDSILARDRLWIVADGMGGHAAGEVASGIAVDVLSGLDENLNTTVTQLVETVRQANDGIFRRASDQPELRGMGTTLTGLALVGTAPNETLAIVNVGDSRAYVVQDGELVQISRDHSYVADLVAAGEITARQARAHPQRNIVTRALGLEPGVEVDAWKLAPNVGDRYLVCSDGLVDEVDDDEILEVLKQVDDPQYAADALVRMANEAGGHDNISVIVVDVLADEPAPVELPPPDPGPAAQTEVGGWLPPDQPPLDTTPVPAPIVPTDPADEAKPPVRTPRSKRVKRALRVALFASVFLAIVAVAVGGIVYYGRRGYYVAFDNGGQVVVRHGQPGGILWVKPTTSRRFELSREQLSPKWQERVASQTITFGTLSAAEEWYSALAGNPDAIPALTTTTTTSTTTTTTVAPTTTLAPATTPPATASPPST